MQTFMEDSPTDDPIFQAHWESHSSGMVALSRDWFSRIQKPPLFLGPEKRPFAKLEAVPPLTFGRMAGYCRLGQRICFLIEESAIPENLRSAELFVGGSFNNWNPQSDSDLYRLDPITIEGETFRTVRIPREVYEDGSTHMFKFVTAGNYWLPVSEAAPNVAFSPDGIQNLDFNPHRTGRHLFSFELPPDHVLMGNEEILWSSLVEKSRHKLPPTVHFHDLSASEDPGVEVDPQKTVFKFFAPRASGVVLEWSRQADPWEPDTVKLSAVGRGLWKATVDENLSGAYYYYRVFGKNRDRSTHFDPDFRILDPYAKAAVSRSGPAIVIDPARLENPNPPHTTPPVADLVIIEAHVRDLVAHAPIPLSSQQRKGFAGTAAWIRSEGSYLRALGVNAVEFQPVQEFDNPTPDDYHWGYMTVNWFSPESSYGSDPLNARQIEEFRDLVAACHENGLSVLLDVVYNHVGEPNNLLFIDKFYYLETAPRFHLMNWSGCGNDLRANTPMARHLIIESLLHLIRAYGVDGFRFDLADLLGKETLVVIETALRAEKPDVVLITEPWSFRGHIAGELRDTTWSSWNDGFRKFAQEYVNGEGNQDGIKHFLGGSVGGMTDHPFQTINYTESHDDLCWLDRITRNAKHNGAVPTASDIRRTHLMLAMLLASLGTPMIASGQDFLRSKYGVNNTYQRGDLNALRYERMSEYSGTHEYVRNWIRFRLSPDGAALRQPERTSNDIEWFTTDNVSSLVAIFTAQNIAGPQLAFAINPHRDPVRINTPRYDLSTWQQIADTWRCNPDGLSTAQTPVDRETVLIPPRSCALWKSPR